MADERLQQFLEVEQARPVAGQRHDIDAEDRLHLGEFVEVIEDHLGHFAALQFDHHAHAVLVGFIAQAADAGQLLVLDELGDLFLQARLVDLIRQLADDDPVAGLLLLDLA